MLYPAQLTTVTRTNPAVIISTMAQRLTRQEGYKLELKTTITRRRYKTRRQMVIAFDACSKQSSNNKNGEFFLPFYTFAHMKSAFAEVIVTVTRAETLDQYN